MSYEQLAPAAWGLGGALFYAVPRLSACLYERGGAHSRCVLDFAGALIGGAISAAAFSPALAGVVPGLKAYPAAVATVIGITANKLAPMITDAVAALVFNALSGKLGEMLKGPGK